MTDRKQRERDKWLQDVQDRQRNIVFPQTLVNETRLWRNIGTRPATPLTWAGLAIFGAFVLGFGGYVLFVILQAGVFWAFALRMVIIFGLIFGLIAWGTHRNLKKLKSAREIRRNDSHDGLDIRWRIISYTAAKVPEIAGHACNFENMDCRRLTQNLRSRDSVPFSTRLKLFLYRPSPHMQRSRSM